MIRIAICCGEGFASGFLSRYLSQAVVKEKLQKEVSFVFIPFFQLYERQMEVDIAMIMAHIEPEVKRDHRAYAIPLYLIPYKVVIQPKAADYLEDAQDILALSNGTGGLISFPEETRTAFVNRSVSHRKWLTLQHSHQKGSLFGL